MFKSDPLSLADTGRKPTIFDNVLGVIGVVIFIIIAAGGIRFMVGLGEKLVGRDRKEKC